MRHRMKIAVAAGGVALMATFGANATAAAGPDHGPSEHHGHHGHDGHHGRALDHIFVIMLENHSQSSVIGDPNAPYLTSLAHRYSMADNYYGVTHPSMPNYLAAISGDTFGIQDDNDQNVVNLDRRNLVDQLESSGINWGAYMETLPANKLDRFGPVVNGTAVSLYAKKHNPFVLFDDVKNNPARMAKVKDYSALSADLNSRHAPQFVWISPNQCNDMHGGVYSAVPGHPETPCPYGS
nr:alkaline phosphatase family protein [Actinomycetota bacterium]